MKIVKSTLPKDSFVTDYRIGDYLDVYKCTINEESNFTPDDLQVLFWTSSPPWVRKLFKIRNSIVKLVGLNTDKENTQKIEDCIRTGKSYKIFSVNDKSEKETVLLLSDKHLDSCMSVYISHNDDNNTDIYIATVVYLHNLLGYLYFYPIIPFHKIVVKGMLKHAINKLIGKKKQQKQDI